MGGDQTLRAERNAAGLSPSEMEREIELLSAELDRLRAALLAHCPNCCEIRWHHGQQR